MFKKYFYSFVIAPLFATSLKSSHVTKFLDSDFRPNAQVITPSSAHWNLNQHMIEFVGNLGAIPSRKKNEYVGFSGVEIHFSQFTPSQIYEATLSFTISHQMNLENQHILAVEIVDIQNESYTYDILLSQSQLSFQLKLKQFQKSYRGRLQSEFYRNQSLKAVRFFYRRSQNFPQSIESIPLNFNLNLKNLKLNSR